MKNLQQIPEKFNFCVTDLAMKLDTFICANLSPYRYEHLLEVARISLELALRQNLSGKKMEKLLIAALTHDITKERSGKFQKDIFKKFNVKEYIKLPHTLYHSKSAPYFIREKFNIEDDEIAHAISYHSTGCTEMPVFSRIIFAADYLASLKPEPEKEKYDLPLKELCMEKTLSTLNYLLLKKMPVQPDSINFYNVLLKEFGYGKQSTEV